MINAVTQSHLHFHVPIPALPYPTNSTWELQNVVHRLGHLLDLEHVPITCPKNLYVWETVPFCWKTPFAAPHFEILAASKKPCNLQACLHIFVRCLLDFMSDAWHWRENAQKIYVGQQSLQKRNAKTVVKMRVCVFKLLPNQHWKCYGHTSRQASFVSCLDADVFSHRAETTRQNVVEVSL